MSIKTAPQVHLLLAGETRNVAVDMSGNLDEGESLTGTPTVATTASGITLSNAAVSTTELTILDAAVEAGKAVTFRMAAASDVETGEFTVLLTVTTNAGQTIKGFLPYRIVTY